MAKNKLGYYKTGYVRENILNEDIDYSRPRMSNIELALEYENLGLRQFKDFEDFTKRNGFRKKDRMEYWQQYLYRDELIARGQYKEIINETYINALIKTIEEVMGKDLVKLGDEIIDNLDRLNSDKLYKLLMLPNGKKGDLSKVFPSISMIYNIGGTKASDEGTEIQLTDEYIRDRIKKAFKTINEPYIEDEKLKKHYEDIKKERQVVIARYTQSRDVIVSTYGRMIRRKGITYEENINTSDALSQLVSYYRRKPNLIRTKKDNTQYIPFLKKNLSSLILDKLK